MNGEEPVLRELEPDIFRVGTNVSHIFDGVTLYRFSNYVGASSANLYNHGPLSHTPVYSPVYIENPTYTGEPSRAPTGSRTFGTFRRPLEAPDWWLGRGNGGGTDRNGNSVLMIQFDRPTNYFEIAGSWLMDQHRIYAFDADAGSVGNETSRTPLWSGSDMTADIAHIGSMEGDPILKTLFIGGWENPALLDRIRFNYFEHATE
jgi:hypothetical protein